MTSTLKGNAFVLDRAVREYSRLAPASAICRDGHHKGTLFTWLGEQWSVVDLENREFHGFHDRLAVVTIGEDVDADDGLNQAALGIDLEVPGGEWVVDADDLEELRETYGDTLEVVWEQGK